MKGYWLTNYDNEVPRPCDVIIEKVYYVLAILRDYKMDFKQYKLNHKDMDRNVKQRTSSGMIFISSMILIIVF